tara:strand:+ start:126180 stop:126857 length:678 start_codon:yes stop_codon:yes gene_type:complete
MRPQSEAVVSAESRGFVDGCLSEDNAFVAFLDSNQKTHVVGVATGKELWKKPGIFVYCDTAGLVFAGIVKGSSIAMEVLDYELGKVVLKAEVRPKGCVGNDLELNSWPTKKEAGLEWHGHRFWGAAYPPDTKFEEEAHACNGHGALWIQRKSGKVRSTEDLQPAEKFSAVAQSQGGLHFKREASSRPSQPDGCGGRSVDKDLVAWRGDTLLWRFPIGSRLEECLP